MRGGPSQYFDEYRFFHRDFFAFEKEVSSGIWLRPEAALESINRLSVRRCMRSEVRWPGTATGNGDDGGRKGRSDRWMTVRCARDCRRHGFQWPQLDYRMETAGRLHLARGETGVLMIADKNSTPMIGMLFGLLKPMQARFFADGSE